MVKFAARGSGHADTIADTERLVWLFGAGLVALVLLRGLGRWIQRAVSERFAQSVIADVRIAMFEHLQRLPLGYFDRRAVGNVVVRFVGDAGSLRSWLTRTIVTLPADALTVIAVLYGIGLIHRELLVAAIVPPLVILPALFIINPHARRCTTHGRREQSRLTGDLAQRFSIMGPIKAAGAEEQSADQVRGRIREIAGLFIRRGRLDAWSHAVAIVAGSLSICAVGLTGATLLFHQQADTGDIVGAVWLAILIRGPINRLTTANIIHQRARVAVERIDALLSRRAEPLPNPTETPESIAGARVRFKNIGHRDPQGRWILRGFTKTFSAPGCVVFVSAQDAGRCLFEMMLRLRKPSEGRVSYDRVNARKCSITAIRRSIGWVDRDRMVIPTVLAAGDPVAIQNAFDSLVILAPEANFEHLCDTQTAPLQPLASTNCDRLRLALACALAANPPILLIEDPTAGLREKEVRLWRSWLAAESERRLIFISSNDPRCRRSARQTVVLDSAPSLETTGLADEPMPSDDSVEMPAQC